MRGRSRLPEVRQPFANRVRVSLQRLGHLPGRPAARTVPVVGLALLVGVDRFVSECRAITSYIGNLVATLFIARWEGALDQERLQTAR
jgi:Na+/H+-dicarboxylate symporter